MDAKFYQCGNELEALIRNQGWVETTDERDKLKGKKELRQTTKARMLIRFDYINLVVFENSSSCHGIGGSRIAAEDLRLLFWYINSTAADKQTISDDHFDVDRARSTYQTMSSLLGYSREFNHMTREGKKIERLLNNFSAINFD